MQHTTPLVTVSGPPAAGTTTLTSQLADVYGFEVLNGGMVFREMAAERGLSLAEFTDLASEDPSIDKELDDIIEAEITAHVEGEREPDGGKGLIVESRLAGWHADGRADLSIWLDAPPEVRASRMDDRDETAEELRIREQSEAKRYEEYYGIDITDRSVYDVVIDTSTVSKEGMVAVAEAALDDVTLAAVSQ